MKIPSSSSTADYVVTVLLLDVPLNCAVCVLNDSDHDCEDVGADKKPLYSESSTSATTLSSGWIGRDRSDILNSSTFKSVSGEGSDGRLCTGAGGLDTDTTTSAEFDMDSVDSNYLEALDNVDGGKHSYKKIER